MIDLRDALLARLRVDFDFRKETPDFLQSGVCPSCGKRSLWMPKKSYTLRCNHQNNCGYEEMVKTRYPELFEHWSKRYEKTEQNPTAAADAYLQISRNFDLSRIRDWYTQDNFVDRKTDESSATVRFAVADTWWERIIDQPNRFDKKANFKYGGSYQGWWWCPPSVQLEKQSEIWLVEGIFDAIALLHHGIAAVALMSCNNYPEKALAQLCDVLGKYHPNRPKLIWALDANTAGKEAILEYVERARGNLWSCYAALPSEFDSNRDWSDLHVQNKLTLNDIENYRYYGDLLIAPSVRKKSELIYRRTKRHAFSVDFYNRLYWVEVDGKKLDGEADDASDDTKEANNALDIIEICGCVPRILYRQVPFNASERLKSSFYVEVRYPRGKRKARESMPATLFGSSNDFNNAMMSLSATFSGSSQQLLRHFKTQIELAQDVYEVGFVGYSKEHHAWIFDNLAVHHGKIYFHNNQDYFELNKSAVRLSGKAISLGFPTRAALDGVWPKPTWDKALWTAYGAKGFVALAYWFGSFFAEQVRAETKSFPFLEIIGEAGSGKTTLINFLWKLAGRVDYEGFDPNKSSPVGRARTLMQTANLPVVLIESDRETHDGKRVHVKGFQWDETKDLYNGNSPRTVGVKTADNQTYSEPFRASIVIAQNNPVDASIAILERICSINFTKAGHDNETRLCAQALEHVEAEDVSFFMLKAIKAEKEVLAMMTTAIKNTEFNAWQRQEGLQGASFRVIENHVKLWLFVCAMFKVFEFNREWLPLIKQFIVQMAASQYKRLSADHPVADEFWNIYDYLESKMESNLYANKSPLNHSTEHEKMIAVNLNEFIEHAKNHGQQIPPIADLKRHLRDSKSRKFIECKTVRSRLLTDKTIRCWIFEHRTKK